MVLYFPRNKMASVSLKGTRKTYSFEEREILITLINKYEDVEERKSDPISMCKRKSAWSHLAEEYNSMVGPQGARSAIQLRRCWENMKACKRNRDKKKSRNPKTFCQLSKDHERSLLHCWDSGAPVRNALEAPSTTGNGCLPPNVVFEPKESEPFTLQSVCIPKPTKCNFKKDLDDCKESNAGGAFKRVSMPQDSTGNKLQTVVSGGSMHEPVDRCIDASTNDIMATLDRTSAEISPRKDDRLACGRSNVGQVSISPVYENARKARKFAHKEEEQQQEQQQQQQQQQQQLQVLAISEAQMKVDIAVMMKEEARIKLEEAHYRKEEARLRMLLFTYKLDRIKSD